MNSTSKNQSGLDAKENPEAVTARKTQAVLLAHGRVVGFTETSARGGALVSYGFHMAQGGGLIETGKAKVSRAKIYLNDDDLIARIYEDGRGRAWVNYGGGEPI